MPLDYIGRPITVTVTVQDLDGNQRPASITFPGSLTIVDILANLAATEAVVAALTNGAVVGGSVTVSLTQTSAFVAPPESSDVERKGSFIFKTAADTTAKYEIPSIDPALVVDGSNIIDPANIAVAGYAAFMVNGYPGAANGPITAAGTSIAKFVKARKMHRSSSNG
jgi:sulfur carrier protein ThiS